MRSAEGRGLIRGLTRVGGVGRGDVVWRFGVGTDQLVPDDPLRPAVASYQDSLRRAMERLCGGTDRAAAALAAASAAYRTADADFAARLTALAVEVGERRGPAAGP